MLNYLSSFWSVYKLDEITFDEKYSAPTTTGDGQDNELNLNKVIMNTIIISNNNNYNKKVIMKNITND